VTAQPSPHYPASLTAAERSCPAHWRPLHDDEAGPLQMFDQAFRPPCSSADLRRAAIANLRTSTPTDTSALAAAMRSSRRSATVSETRMQRSSAPGGGFFVVERLLGLDCFRLSRERTVPRSKLLDS
jgi:hypothetical protein